MTVPTYAQCVRICEENEAFRMKEEIVNGVTVHIFKYFVAGFENFKRPIENEPEYDWLPLEMRGITFVLEPKHSSRPHARYLGIRKFFNYSENELTQPKIIECKQILRVQEKFDGSLISPIVINDEIFCKTKSSFYNEQAESANKIIKDNKKYSSLIKFLNEQNIVSFWELCSPKNKIVVDYDSETLVFIQARNNITGELIF